MPQSYYVVVVNPKCWWRIWIVKKNIVPVQVLERWEESLSDDEATLPILDAFTQEGCKEARAPRHRPLPPPTAA